MMRHEKLLDFWRQPEPENNVPQDFTLPTYRSEALAYHIASVAKDARILEVGCNVGRNLAYLTDRGWRHLEGLEINPHAVDLLRTTYPQLEDTPIHLGAAEDVLPTLTEPYDLIFTMAVLEHIHPDAMVVFDEIARLASRLLAIEPVGGNHDGARQYPHDLQSVFEERHMRLVSIELVNHPQTRDVLEDDFFDYAAWWFVR